MRRLQKRALALLLAAFMLALCACAAKPQTQAAAEAATAAQTQINSAKKEEDASKEETPQEEQAQEASPEEEKSAEDQPQTIDEKESSGEEATIEQRPPLDEQTPAAEPAAQDGPLTCTISISCAAILEHMDELDPEKVELVPEDGWILAPVTVEFTQGQNVFDVLLETVKANAIHMEYQNTPMYETAYIEGIGNLYEFDCGALSGWMYRVNGWFPNYGCSRYAVQAGDVIEWMYTCDLGSDVGGSGVSQGYEE